VYVTVIAAAFALSTAVTWVVDRNDNTLAGLGDATTARNGRIVDAEGDSMFAVFPRPADAVMAALAAQRAMAQEPWPDGATVSVRMGIHSGPVSLEGGHLGERQLKDFDSPVHLYALRAAADGSGRITG